MAFRWPFSSRGLDRDLHDELDSHVEMRAAELIAEGWKPDEARAEAARRFGNAALLQEQTREVHVGTAIESVLKDVRFSVRSLLRQPAFTIAAVLTLALAIGSNGAIFSLVEAMLLRPLAIERGEQLVTVWGTSPDLRRGLLSVLDVEDMGKAKSLQNLGAMFAQSVSLTGGDEPVRVTGAFVTGDYFRMMRVSPTAGRNFLPDEDRPGGNRVVILTHGLWQNRFGGDPSILGRTLRLNGDSYSVVGILPSGFVPPVYRCDVFLPLPAYPNYRRERANASVLAMGRLADGATIEQARAELETISQQLAAAHPATNRTRGVAIEELREMISGQSKPVLYMLAAAVGFVLLVACANVAGLMLTRSVARRHEFALRTALGASTGRLMRQLLTESLVLSLAGCALGLVLAHFGTQLLLLQTEAIGITVEARLNTPVTLFMLAASVLSALLFGLAPAFAIRKSTSLMNRHRGTGVAHNRLRSAIAAGQVALALLLLAGAGLIGVSLRELLLVNPGFQGDQLLTMEYRLPRTKYPNGVQQAAFHSEVADRISRLPGVVSAAVIRALPFSGNFARATFSVPGQPEAPPDNPYIARYNTATVGYFQTAGIPLLAGRDFQASDTAESAQVVIANRSLAERFWPGGSALGRPIRLRMGARTVTATIVGVVGDVKHTALEEPQTSQLYMPYSQDPFIFGTLVVRTAVAPLSIARDVQKAVWSLDSEQPVWAIRTLADVVDRTLNRRRFVLNLMGAFSGAALLLAVIGLYGVLSYGVSQRTGEFGIRLAMGARSEHLLWMVARSGLAITGTGIVIGMLAAMPLASLIRSQLFRVTEFNLAVYAAVALALAIASIPAVVIPARRATRVDPVLALRQE